MRVEDLQAHGIPGQGGGHCHDACPRALHLGGPGAGALTGTAIVGQPRAPGLAAHQQKKVMFQRHGLCKGRERMLVRVISPTLPLYLSQHLWCKTLACLRTPSSQPPTYATMVWSVSLLHLLPMPLPKQFPPPRVLFVLI